MGEAEKKRIASDYRLIPWRFSKMQFESIWKTNAGLKENGLSIANQDLKLECKEDKYQKIEVTFAGAAIWQKNDGFKKEVLARAMEFYEKLIPFREMTTDQLRTKLGIGGPAVSDVTADDFDSTMLTV